MSTTKDGAVRGRALGRRRDDGSHGIVMAICLPRDELSVPLIRHLLRNALTELGVVKEITEDLLLVLTEACTNVVDHSGPGDEYDVTVTINPERCELRIIDIGHGFDHASVAAAAQDDGLHTERGRGLGLMQALVDHVELSSEPEEGTLVRLVKSLTFDEAAPARRLLLQGD